MSSHPIDAGNYLMHISAILHIRKSRDLLSGMNMCKLWEKSRGPFVEVNLGKRTQVSFSQGLRSVQEQDTRGCIYRCPFLNPCSFPLRPLFLAVNLLVYLWDLAVVPCKSTALLSKDRAIFVLIWPSYVMVCSKMLWLRVLDNHLLYCRFLLRMFAIADRLSDWMSVVVMATAIYSHKLFTNLQSISVQSQPFHNYYCFL